MSEARLALLGGGGNACAIVGRRWSRMLKELLSSSGAMADLAKDVANAIDEMRPYLERSGATLELLGIEDGIAHVVASTAARGHLVSNLSFVAGIESALMDKVPGLRGLAAVNLPPYTVIGWDKPSLTGGIGLARERMLD